MKRERTKSGEWAQARALSNQIQPSPSKVSGEASVVRNGHVGGGGGEVGRDGTGV